MPQDTQAISHFGFRQVWRYLGFLIIKAKSKHYKNRLKRREKAKLKEKNKIRKHQKIGLYKYA